MPALTDYPREYLSPSFDPTNLDQVREAYATLAARPLPDAEALERWCRDWSELSAAVYEEWGQRHIDTTLRTSDEGVKARFVEWQQTMVPQIKELDFTLSKRLAGHTEADALPREEFAIFLRSVRNHVDLFREENIPLEKEESLLVRDYDEVTGGWTVTFEGEERTIPAMTRFLEDQDRDRREAAWRAIGGPTLQDRDRLDGIFDRMLALRSRAARNAGFEEYRTYRFRQLERFDYTPADCEEFHRSIEEIAVPVRDAFHRRRRETLDLEALRPWDLSVDPEGLPPLSPFQTVGELIEGARAVFAAVDPRFGRQFDILVETGRLDLETRKGKAPGGYQANLQERRLPFIFMNACGTHHDVITLLHEGGHAFHSLAHRDQSLMWNRGAPSEFSEVASMSMELIACGRLEAGFYTDEDACRARARLLRERIMAFPRFAMVDAFQHWIYTHPGHTASERAEAWMACEDRFEGEVDWSGLEDRRTGRWQQVLHIFHSPFYFLDYAIANLGALQVWRNYLEDPGEAIGSLLHAFSLGDTRPLPGLFEAAGARFDFSAETLRELLDFAGARYEELLGA